MAFLHKVANHHGLARSLGVIGDSQSNNKEWHTTILPASAGITVVSYGKSSGKAGWPLERDYDEDPASTFVDMRQWLMVPRHRVYVEHFGHNDFSSGYHAELTHAQRLELFATQIVEIWNRVRSIGADIVTTELLKLDIDGGHYTADPGRNDSNFEMVEIKRALAIAHGVPIVRLWDRFSAEIDEGNWDFHKGVADLHYNDIGESSTGDSGNEIVADEVEITLDDADLLKYLQ